MISYTHPNVSPEEAYGYNFHYHSEEHTLEFSARAGDLVKIPCRTVVVSVVWHCDLNELGYRLKREIGEMVRQILVKDLTGLEYHHMTKTSAPF